MNKRSAILVAVAAAVLIGIFSCGPGKKGGGTEIYYPLTINDVYTQDPQDQYFFENTSTAVNLTYNLDLGTPGAGKSVYFIFTNTSLYFSAAAPSVQSVTPDIIPAIQADMADIDLDAFSDSSQTENLLLKGTPEISEYNRLVHRLGTAPAVNEIRSSMAAPAPPRLDTFDSSVSFSITESTTESAVCKYSAVIDGRTLNIYVPMSRWSISATPPDGYVNQQMVNDLAAKFLTAGTDNDIYDWVTNIYGAEWGAHTDPNLIDPDNSITILLFDVPFANVAGYFYSKDNYKNLSWSNKRIMFYLDLVYYSTREGGTWEMTDKYPSQIISTLAHEFQHMIHFYQKPVLRSNGVNSDAWIDEMCSMVTEDLVARKLGVQGPRGVAYNDPSAGPGAPLSSLGRFPNFNTAMDTAIAYWYSGTDLAELLHQYATKYAFGAYLARNYSGALFFKNIVYNANYDYRAVQYALDQEAGADTFTTALRKWGVACLQSDKVMTNPYRYNNGASWMTSTIGAINYDLGSINLNYYTPQPVIFAYGGSSLPASSLPVTANRYYRAGTGLTGSHTWDISMDSRTKLTVVVRD